MGVRHLYSRNRTRPRPEHPGDYNGGSPTYAVDALYTHDSQQYTIMSYFEASNTGADWVASNGHEYYAQTPMMDDVMVIQAIYGADTTTRSGNTTYGFNSTAGSSVFDFTVNLHPVLCIYDAAGNDTIDLSGWNTASKIDLTPGSFSNADMMTYNISIARSAWIENAIGGGGNDTCRQQYRQPSHRQWWQRYDHRRRRQRYSRRRHRHG